MLTVNVYHSSGKILKKITLPQKIFSAKVNPALMAQAVRIYLSNQRQAPAAAKTRGEVSLSGRKIYRQKGTGRARHGDRKAPIFIKGGVAHGPTKEQNFKLKMSKKMRRKALFSALTAKLKDKEIIVVDGLEKIEPKTKKMIEIIENLSLNLSTKENNKRTKIKITFILPQVLGKVIRAGRNIPGVSLKQAKLLNTYEVLNGGKLVFTPKSIKVMKETYGIKSGN